MGLHRRRCDTEGLLERYRKRSWCDCRNVNCSTVNRYFCRYVIRGDNSRFAAVFGALTSKAHNGNCVMAARQDQPYVPLECASRHEHARSHRNPADSRGKPNSESGQAILLLIVFLSLFMLGAVGLGIDGAQIYAHYQMAQAAADAAAQAGMMSIYDGTNATSAYPFATGITPAAFVCTITDQRMPCVYARYNGFGSTNSDTVTVSFPATV